MATETTEKPLKITKSDRSKGQLIEAASSILREKNTINLTLSELAERSNLNSALVKYHFGNKDGLLFAVLEHHSEKWLKALENLLQRTDLTPEEKMRRHLYGLMDTYVQAPFIRRLHNSIMGSTTDENRLKISDGMIKPVIKAQKEILDAGYEQGIFRKIDAELFYFSASGAVSFIYTQNFILKHTFKHLKITDELISRTKEQIVDMVLRGIKV